MIKRKEVISTDKSKGEIIGNIMLDLDAAPALDSTYLYKSFNSSKRFYGSIKNDKISLSTKGILYWPAFTIELEAKENKTILRITYRMFWLYTITYLLMFIPFVISLSINTIERGLPSNEEQPEGLLLFIAAFILLPFLGRWLQRNTVKFLVNF